MVKTYYHATPFENFESIARQGILKSRYDGMVYLTEKPEEAARFLAIRLCREILVCEVQVDESLVEETFDHNEGFFKCRAYGHHGDVEPDKITGFYKYAL